MSQEANQCRPDQLWIPGMHLDAEFPTPTDSELAEAWANYTGRPTLNSTEVFGALSMPTRPIQALASVDLCEVVRRTSASFDLAIGEEPHDRSIYAKYDWLTTDERGNDFTQSVVVSIVRTLMNNRLVAPRLDIDILRATLQKWRAAGVYVIANTSTLPGCELGTIQDFSTTYNLSDCFDGLLLPRNHDGRGTVTKATALKSASHDLGLDFAAIPFLHIDDSLHHIDGFVGEHAKHPAMALFIPEHADNTAQRTDMHCETTSEALQKATQFLRQSGVEL